MNIICGIFRGGRLELMPRVPKFKGWKKLKNQFVVVFYEKKLRLCVVSVVTVTDYSLPKRKKKKIYSLLRRIYEAFF